MPCDLKDQTSCLEVVVLKTWSVVCIIWTCISFMRGMFVTQLMLRAVCPFHALCILVRSAVAVLQQTVQEIYRYREGSSNLQLCDVCVLLFGQAA